MTTNGRERGPKRTGVASNASHPIRIGAIAKVVRMTQDTGLPFVEGEAVVIESIAHRPHFYRVRFLGERLSTTRFVHPDWQTDTERSLALLYEMCRASALPEFEEFFPDENN